MVFMGMLVSGAQRGAKKPPGPSQENTTTRSVSSAPQSSDAAAGARKAPAGLVLIVEDEEPIAVALAYIVEDAGYTPLVAMHGKQALEIARTQQPALILTDLMMPQMSGKELIDALRREWHERGWPLPPIILMTAASARAASEVEADATLPKPFEIDQVEALLHAWLSDR